MGEQELIDALCARVPHDGFLRGPGDDAAVLEVGRLAWATDLSIEGSHFDLRCSSVSDAAAKALVRNLSDLAAMGAEPVAFLAAVALPAEGASAVIDQVAEGFAEICSTYQIKLAGGDLASGDRLLFAITVLGRLDVPQRDPTRRAPSVLEQGWLGRDGARVGDVVAVTGALGGGAAGLALWRRAEGGDDDVREHCAAHPEHLARYRRGIARVAQGRGLLGLATSAIDVSDGIAIDLGRTAAASGVRVVLDPVRIPLGHSALYAGDLLDVEPLGFAFGGDDYELAITCSPERFEAARAACAPVPLTAIGTVEEGQGVVDPHGRRFEGGHDHFD